MRVRWFPYLLFLLATTLLLSSFDGSPAEANVLEQQYRERLSLLRNSLTLLIRKAENIRTDEGMGEFKAELIQARSNLKSSDLWTRYLEPVAYRLLNGPLPVEWENEVFEKYEPPYRRPGAGLILAENYLEEESPDPDSLRAILRPALDACEVFLHDSIAIHLRSADAFFYANRLFLLNLAAIYTTGYECPDTGRIIPELQSLCQHAAEICRAFEQSFPDHPLPAEYHRKYQEMQQWLNQQSGLWSEFSHFRFISEFVDPLFALNQDCIRRYKPRSLSFNDYTLSRKVNSIFDKDLYEGQDFQGVFRSVTDEGTRQKVIALGRMLFYDPILSGNGKRACASCHVPQTMFTDTSVRSALQFDRLNRLPRNTPSLPQAIHQHLLMADGKHIDLFRQMKDVISNPVEMAGDTLGLLKKVLSCPEYREQIRSLAKHTSVPKPHIDHVLSAITAYVGSFAFSPSPFDSMMLAKKTSNPAVVRGFDLFMGKALCGSCHFVPHFGGVRPPYLSSEFEVLGTPVDTSYSAVSPDSGRFLVHRAPEMMRAFRTPSLRNSALTAPYMHNGVFGSLEEVLEFYNAGGGAGKKLSVPNQTLDAEPLQLTEREKRDLIAFLRALTEDIRPGNPPDALPLSSIQSFRKRTPGGEY